MKRFVMVGMLTVGLCHGALADPREFSPDRFIPGSPTYWNWAGFYIGGQFGMSSSNFDPSGATASLVGYLLRHTTIEQEAQVSQWPQLPRTSATGTNYGGFAGYNAQWEDVILGFELAYNFGSNMSSRSSDGIRRLFSASDGYLYDVQVDSRASMVFKDFGTLKARAGYVMGRFLPYAQVGAAVARADLYRDVRVRLRGTDSDPLNPPVLPPVGLNASASDGKKDAFIYGITAGLGVDIGITESIFVRAEYEFIHFFPVQSMSVNINTGRIGVGVKF
jgi:opacity protein-like surface antigen